MPYADPEQQKKFGREWLKARRTEWLKKNGPCRQCGSDKCLEVDHINPEEKKVSPSRVWSLSEGRREQELKKCQVLCCVCHRKKTNEYRLRNVAHGSERMYRKFACRCPACCLWKQQENSKRKERGWF